ncbi:MAG: hypothetical protein U9N49_07295 [Campylobacterota bacterium]|nr:hypothetical protein [Campylobacterota bacterium]
MKLEKIYNILKNFSLEEFYTPKSGEPTFIYKYDVNLTIQQSNNANQEDIGEYNKFIVDLYQSADIQQVDSSVSRSQWNIKYGDNTIYRLFFLCVGGMMVPLSLKPADYEYNFCKVYNTTNHVHNAFKLDHRLKVVKTSFDDFYAH